MGYSALWGPSSADAGTVVAVCGYSYGVIADRLPGRVTRVLSRADRRLALTPRETDGPRCTAYSNAARRVETDTQQLKSARPTTFPAVAPKPHPGGVLGVIDHRARPGTTFSEQIASGYMDQDYVIGLARDAGFQLSAQSQINANPKDMADHPGGVWNLPPSLRNVAPEDAERMRDIGESDRMTLKFIKR